jgi:hypothetical protein
LSTSGAACHFRSLKIRIDKNQRVRNFLSKSAPLVDFYGKNGIMAALSGWQVAQFVMCAAKHPATC